MFICRLLNIIVGQKVSHNDKARSSARKGLGKLRILECKTHVLQRIVLYFKGVTVNTENYNQQSRSLHLRKLQSAKPFSAVLYIVEGYDWPTPVKAKTKRKGKIKERRKRKGIMEEARLKNIPLERTAPSEYVPWSSSINGLD